MICTPPVSGAITNQSDRLAHLLLSTGKEDREAFREVYSLTSAKLYGICVRICGRDAAEDVLHDVYLIVWRRAGAFEPRRGSAIAWLATIARNRSIDWIRARDIRRTSPLDDLPDIVDPSPGAEVEISSRETTLYIGAYLSQLKPCQRDAIHTAFYEGVTYAILSERSGVPVSTVKSWVRRGLAELRGLLEHVDISPA